MNEKNIIAMSDETLKYFNKLRQLYVLKNFTTMTYC